MESPVQLLNVLEWAHLKGAAAPLTIVVLPPKNPAARGQLRRMAQLARDEGHAVVWREARGGSSGVRALAALVPRLRHADPLVIGDPFSRWLQLLLCLARAERTVVVDDGTATLEFTEQLARGEALVRWHRAAPSGPLALAFAPVARRAVRRLTPAGGRDVELFSAMPVDAPKGITVRRNAFAWTRERFGPPEVRGADLVGTSLVETGVVRADDYLRAVRVLAGRHGITRYFAHRREHPEKLRRVAGETGLQVVRPDLPLELVARRGPIGARVFSFPSTVVHTLPLVLADTGARVTVCEIDDAWLTEGASPRASGFLSAVTRSARGTHGMVSLATPP